MPKNKEDYSACIINRVQVYLPKGFESPFPLTINVHNLCGWRVLYLTGWKPV